jgi:hypothetical protein
VGNLSAPAFEVSACRWQSLECTWLPCLVSEPDEMASESLRDGNEEIYTMNAGGSDQRNLTVHSASDSHPDWQPTSWR